MILLYPDAHIAPILTGPQGPCKYAIKSGNLIFDSIIKSLVSKIHATFGGKIAGVLVLPLLWMVFEGNIMVNGYTFPIIPNQLASLIKEHWIAAKKSPMDNPIEKISLAVQQLGNQLAIIPLIRHSVQTGGGGIVAAPLGLGQEPVDGNNGAAAGAPSLKAKGQCQLQMQGWRGYGPVSHRLILEHYYPNNSNFNRGLSGGQQCYLQNMHTNIRRIAIQPVVCPAVHPSLIHLSLGHLDCMVP